MPLYSQTLDDIPEEFLTHHKSSANERSLNPGAGQKLEDLLFILAVLMFLNDEPYFSKIE